MVEAHGGRRRFAAKSASSVFDDNDDDASRPPRMPRRATALFLHYGQEAVDQEEALFFSQTLMG